MEPTSQRRSKSPYDAIRTQASLHRAWSVVRDNGLASSSPETREEIKFYSKELTRNLNRISTQLRENRFSFGKAKALLIKKKSGSPRPVVVAPVGSRIVQRAILDTIQRIPAIFSELHAGYNFGGVEGKNFGVPAAIKKTLSAAQEKNYYIRTDIKSFFTAVPREEAVSRIAAHIDDKRFNEFLKEATDTELADMAKLGEKAKLFPLAEDGVAQGSCLSPLLCNYLLSDFDRAMNSRGIVCVRYIDDFIIFGPDRKSTFKAFRAGLTLLRNLGLAAYDPLSSSDEERRKADHGSTEEEFKFLGCDIRRDRVRPSKSSRNKLIREVTHIFDSVIDELEQPKRSIITGNNYAEAIRLASNKIRGWGNTYSFCTDDQLMKNIDIEITERFVNFNDKMKYCSRKLSDLDKRRVFGLFCLEDCNRDPPGLGTRLLVSAYVGKKTQAEN